VKNIASFSINRLILFLLVLSCTAWPAPNLSAQFGGSPLIFEGKNLRLFVPYRGTSSCVFVSNPTNDWVIKINGEQRFRSGLGGSHSLNANIPIRREEYGTTISIELQVWRRNCTSSNRIDYVTGQTADMYLPFYEEFAGNTSITFSNNVPEQGCGFRVGSWDGVPSAGQVSGHLYNSPATSFVLPKGNTEYGFTFNTGNRNFRRIRYYYGRIGEAEGPVRTVNNPSRGTGYAFTYRPTSVYLKADKNYTRLLVLECYNANNAIAQVVAVPVIVTGTQTEYAKDADGNFLTTESAPMPSMVLHNPPGDESFTYIAEETSTCSEVNYGFANGNNQAADVKVTVGSDVSVFGVNIESEFSVTGSYSRSSTRAGESSAEVCRTITSTVENQNGFTGEDGDLFIGNSTIFRYGPALEVVYRNCRAETRNKALNFLAVDMKDFTYLKADIENDVIPNIDRARSGLNQSSVAWKELTRNRQAWVNMVRDNHRTRESAPAISGIITLNGDRAPIGAEVSVERSQAYATSSTLIIDASLLVEAGVSVGGSGVSASTEIGISSEVSRGSSSSQTSVQTFGYSLQDDDEDDRLLVRAKRDRKWGTHIFELENGSRSSCPYEGGAQLNQPELFALENGAERKEITIYAPAGSAAQIPLRIKNGSTIAEVSSEYLLQGGNLADADVELGAEGIGLDNQTKEYELAGGAFIDLVEGSGQDLLYVKQNANSPNQLNYEGIEILLKPSCEDELDRIFDRILLNVFFELPPAITPGDRTVDAPAGSTSFRVGTSTTWTATSDADWLTINSANGNGNGNFTVAYAANPFYTDRVASILITTRGGAQTTVQLTQEPACADDGENDADEDGIPGSCDLCPTTGSIGMAFDGVDDYLEVEPIADFNTGENTIEMWLYLEALPVNSRSWPLFLGVWNSGQHWIINTDGTASIGAFGRTHHRPQIPLREWTHLAAVFDGSAYTLYINGEEYGSFNTRFNYPDPRLSVGGVGFGYEHHNGKMDEIRIWNTARTQAEIQTTMRTELAGTEANLAAYYNFGTGLPGANNACAPVVIDKAGINDLTLIDFAQTGIRSNWTTGAPIRLRNLDEFDEGNACQYSPGNYFVGLPLDTIRVRVDTASIELPVVNSGMGAYESPFVSGTTFNVDQAGVGTYTVFYTAPGDGPACSISDSLTVVITSLTSTMDAAFLADLSIGPNPVQDQLSIHLERRVAEPLQIRLWDTNGRLFRNVQLPRAQVMDYTMPVADLPAGLYLLSFNDASGHYLGTRKVVKR